MADQNHKFGMLLGFGLTGASFASVLVIFSLKHQTSETLTAAKYFSVCIPITVAFQFLSELYDLSQNALFKRVLLLISSFTLWAGFVGCIVGIYYVFRHISVISGEYFKNICIFSTIFISVILILHIILDRTSDERNDHNKEKHNNEETKGTVLFS